MSVRHRIGIADDHHFWRQTIADIIKKHFFDADVAQEAVNGRQLIDQIVAMDNDSLPSLVILDLNMPVMDGYETARWLYLNRPEIKIVALSLEQDERSIIRLMAYGVLGFLQKNIDGEELLAGIETVLKGEMYFSAFENAYGRDSQPNMEALQTIKEVVEKWNLLSRQDKEFMRYCCADMTNVDIAKAMKMDRTSVDDLTARLCGRFGVNRRLGLALLAHKNKLV